MNPDDKGFEQNGRDRTSFQEFLHRIKEEEEDRKYREEQERQQKEKEEIAFMKMAMENAKRFEEEKAALERENGRMLEELMQLKHIAFTAPPRKNSDRLKNGQKKHS